MWKKVESTEEKTAGEGIPGCAGLEAKRKQPT